MAGDAEAHAELVSVASVFIFDAQADCAMLTLALYEIMLTFDREVQLVWQQKFNGATLLFLLNRYISLLRLSIIIFLVLLFSDKVCSYGPFLVAGLEYSLLLIIAVFFALRVYALTKHTILPALLVFVLLAVPLVTNVYITTLTTTRTLPPPLFCITSIHISIKLYEKVKLFINTSSRLSILTRTCVLVGDLLVVLITWYTTYRTWRASRTAQFKVSLSTLLLRDGTIYFVVILVLSALQLLFLFINDIRNIETTFADTLMPLLISRLILNLREFDSAGNSTSVASFSEEKTTTVMFASAPGARSSTYTYSDSGSFLDEKGFLNDSEKAGGDASNSRGFAAFIDPLGAPVDHAFDLGWDEQERNTDLITDDREEEERAAWNAALDAVLNKARQRVWSAQMG
ncbi:hypothetical protein L226DRAFT_615446 [Lentinus tigrinus ALCF2SS1-7]|uniref:uncharacterized protein n=1 Tax=Lentinus tigrinus ALCF2SS1-7 TaxID=1328758 RepID=UPI0011660EA4|nr:hypothetical protein L226DRAFT_615446 [Lentinus tigrinus ALCF2SS1-7]